MRTIGLGIVITLALGASWRTGAANIAQATASAASEGRLVTRVGERTVDLPLEHTDVHIRVDGHIAEATVTQRFENKGDQPIDAFYLFPLPGDAAVDKMTIETSGRVIEGKIHRRSEAKRIYKRARKAGRLAALLEQQRENLFTQSVANIEPGAVVSVVIRYVQPLVYDDGGYELSFPMVAPPRYTPGSAPASEATPALPPAVRPTHDISLVVELDAGVSVKGLESPSHRIETSGEGRRRRVALATGDSIPNRDFVLRYRVAGDAPELAVLAHRGADKERGSFFLVAQPPATASGLDVRPREIVFVLDTSSSMRERPLQMARNVIDKVLAGMQPRDTYQIVRFSDAASALGSAPIANKPRNLALTREWLAKLRAGGGTEMVSGIQAALAVPHDPGRLRVVVFLTDGFIGNEDEILAMVGENMGAARLFAFGVGSSVNRYLLEEMSLAGRGAAQLVSPSDDADEAAAALYRRIDRPVLTDIEIDWNGLAVDELSPARIPDLFAGQPLVVAGRYREAGASTVVVTGQRGGERVRFEVPVELPARADRRAVASVWARRKIADLTRAEIKKNDPARVETIVQIALEHELMSRWTSFVAVDGEPETTGVEVPRAARSVTYGASQGAIGSGAMAMMSTGVGYGRSVNVVARMSKPAVIRIGRATVRGDLSADIIRNQVRRRTAQVRHCYERALMTKPDLAGTAVAKIRVAPNGVVQKVAVTGMANAKVTDCITRVLRTLEFPKWDGDTVNISYPFILKPSGKKKALDVEKNR